MFIFFCFLIRISFLISPIHLIFSVSSIVKANHSFPDSCLCDQISLNRQSISLLFQFCNTEHLKILQFSQTRTFLFLYFSLKASQTFRFLFCHFYLFQREIKKYRLFRLYCEFLFQYLLMNRFHDI